MQTPNPQRGEIALTLVRQGARQQFVLAPTYAALVEIESATGRGIIELLHLLALDRWKVQEVTAIVTAGLRAATPGPPYPAQEDVGQMIVETGVEEVIKALSPFLRGALTGGRTAEELAAAARGKDAAPASPSSSATTGACSDSVAAPSDGPPISSGAARPTKSPPSSTA